MHIKSKFCFFKAGQGLFYGGKIYCRESKQVFTIVYDCGTSGRISNLYEEIDYFKRMNYYLEKDKEDKIDLLFISHLHYDHVSGIKHLLEKFKVENIILPYIDKN